MHNDRRATINALIYHIELEVAIHDMRKILMTRNEIGTN